MCAVLQEEEKWPWRQFRGHQGHHLSFTRPDDFCLKHWGWDILQNHGGRASQKLGGRTWLSRSSGVEPPSRAARLMLPPQWAWRAEYQTKDDYFWASAAHGICLTRFWTCLGPITPFFFLISSFWNGNVCPMPIPQLCLGSTYLVWLHRFRAGEKFFHRLNCISAPTHIWFRWYFDETLDF